MRSGSATRQRSPYAPQLNHGASIGVSHLYGFVVKFLSIVSSEKHQSTVGATAVGKLTVHPLLAFIVTPPEVLHAPLKVASTALAVNCIMVPWRYIFEQLGQQLIWGGISDVTPPVAAPRPVFVIVRVRYAAQNHRSSSQLESGLHSAFTSTDGAISALSW